MDERPSSPVTLQSLSSREDAQDAPTIRRKKKSGDPDLDANDKLKLKPKISANYSLSDLPTATGEGDVRKKKKIQSAVDDQAISPRKKDIAERPIKVYACQRRARL